MTAPSPRSTPPPADAGDVRRVDRRAVEQAVVQAAAAAADWGRAGAARVAALPRLAGELRVSRTRSPRLMTAEMGKPIGEAEGEVEKSAVTAEYYAAQGGAILADEPVEIDGVQAWVSYEPIGLVLAVMPWNFPVWQVLRFAVPTLAAGNGVLLKHSPNVTGSALAIEQLFRAAGFPEHLVSTLVVDEPDVPATIEAADRGRPHRRRHADRQQPGRRRGRCGRRARVEAVRARVGRLGCVRGARRRGRRSGRRGGGPGQVHNSGQSCVCAKRFIVEAAVADEFIDRFVVGVKGLAVGDPTDPGTDVGPLARDDLRAALQRQVDESVAAGRCWRRVAAASTGRVLLRADRACRDRSGDAGVRRGDVRPGRRGGGGARCCHAVGWPMRRSTGWA